MPLGDLGKGIKDGLTSTVSGPCLKTVILILPRKDQGDRGRRILRNCAGHFTFRQSPVNGVGAIVGNSLETTRAKYRGGPSNGERSRQ